MKDTTEQREETGLVNDESSSAEPQATPPVEPAENAEDRPTEAASEDAPAGGGEKAAAGSEGEKGGDAGTDKRQDPEAAKAKAARAHRAAGIYRAFRGGRVLDGRVEKVIKGGYEIKIAKVRGFCPHSQMDVRRIEDPESLVGKTLSFKITQVRRGGADVVVTHRAVVEDARRDEANAVRATLIEGSLMLGHVAGFADFGAFVDLGAGVLGLVHVSEVSHNRIKHASEVLKDNEAVRVKILKIDEAKGRISLSVRQAQADPWEQVAEKFEPGKDYEGTIRRLTPFGAFVEIAEGVEALAPVGEFPPHRLGWKEGLEVGQTCQWRVLSVDPKARRIALRPTQDDEVEAPELKPGLELKGRIQRIERFGVFVWLGPGKVGLMPNVLTGTPPGTDLARRFPLADEIEVEVVEIEEGGRRIRLAAKGAKVRAERNRPSRERLDEGPIPDRRRRRDSRSRPDRPTAPVSSDAGFGQSLADKLRAALEKSD